jgi:hypothetical protein
MFAVRAPAGQTRSFLPHKPGRLKHRSPQTTAILIPRCPHPRRSISTRKGSTKQLASARLIHQSLLPASNKKLITYNWQLLLLVHVNYSHRGHSIAHVSIRRPWRTR